MQSNTISEIIPGTLWLSSGIHAIGPGVKELGITHIMNCASSVVCTSKAWYRRRGLPSIQFASVDARDAPGALILQRHLSKTLRLFQSANISESTPRKIFVHCYAGCNRSPTLALAAIMLTRRENLFDVVRRAVRARPCILSNQSFRKQLVDLASREGLLPCRTTIL